MPKSLARVPSTPKKRRRRWSAEDARQAIAAQLASGLSVKKFAEREGLDAERIYRWKRILAAGSVAVPTFVEVRAPEESQRNGQMELVLRSGHRLFFAESVAASALRRLLQVLE